MVKKFALHLSKCWNVSNRKHERLKHYEKYQPIILKTYLINIEFIKERKIFSCKNNDLGPWSPSSYVMIFSTLAINVMKLSVLSHLDDVFHLLHVLHVLQIYSIFSHPGWQDSTIFGALLQDNRHCRKYWPISGHTLPEA